MCKGGLSLVSVSKGTGKGPIFFNLQWQGHWQGTYYFFFPQLVDDEDYLSMGGGDGLTGGQMDRWLVEVCVVFVVDVGRGM